MSSSDSIDASPDRPEPSSPDIDPDVDPAIDPAIAEAVDGVTNRFGAEGLESMIAYAETSLTRARAALAALGDAVDRRPGRS
jgi:hypothetical protein